MTRAARDILLVVLYVLFGVVAATLSGYLTIGRPLFKDISVVARFVVVGFSGSLIYAAVRLRRPGFGLLTIGFFFLAQLALTPPLSVTSALNAALWTLPVGALFLASAFLFRVLRWLPIGKFLLMAVMVGAGYGLLTIFFLLKDHVPFSFTTVFHQAYAGLKLGGLVGLGIELVDLITRNRTRHEAEAPEAASR